MVGRLYPTGEFVKQTLAPLVLELAHGARRSPDQLQLG